MITDALMSSTAIIASLHADIALQELLRPLHLRGAEERLGRPFLHHAAVVHEDDLVGRLAGEAHLMGDDRHGHVQRRTSPVFLVFCADPRRLERIDEMRGRPQPNRDIEGFLNASVDAALAMQTFIFTIEAIGLGCCPISVIRNKLPLVVEVLKLPDGVFPVAGLCVGYPADEGHVSMRRPPSVTIHTDEYKTEVVEPGIDAYDRARHERHALKREQQRNPAKFGYADFYGWSEDKARQAAEPEGAAFAEYIRRTWFRF